MIVKFVYKDQSKLINFGDDIDAFTHELCISMVQSVFSIDRNSIVFFNKFGTEIGTFIFENYVLQYYTDPGFEIHIKLNEGDSELSKSALNKIYVLYIR